METGKANQKYDRLYRRGENGVKLEIYLVAIGHNIRKYHSQKKIKWIKKAVVLFKYIKKTSSHWKKWIRWFWYFFKKIKRKAVTFRKLLKIYLLVTTPPFFFITLFEIPKIRIRIIYKIPVIINWLFNEEVKWFKSTP